MSVAPVAGARLGTYQLVRPVGRGGFGQVWLAEDPHGARVAVKVLQQPDGAGPDPSFRSWFTREYRTGSRVDSRFIATPFDADLDAEPPWIAFRYVEGRTLRRLIGSEPLTHGRVALIAVQILRGLSELHEAGLVHRDIKPENVMISPGDHVTILDLGIVHDPTATKVSRGAQLGTPGYLAPEAVQGLATGPAMDIWAFAVTVADMLCPERLYTGTHPAEAVRATHPRWADLVQACFADDPDRRPTAPTIIASITGIGSSLDGVTSPERGSQDRNPSANGLRPGPDAVVGHAEPEATPEWPEWPGRPAQDVTAAHSANRPSAGTATAGANSGQDPDPHLPPTRAERPGPSKVMASTDQAKRPNPPHVVDPHTLAPVPIQATQPASTSVREAGRPLLIDNRPAAATALGLDEPVVTAQTPMLTTGHVQRPPTPAPIERHASTAERMASERETARGTPVPVAGPRAPRSGANMKSIVVGLAVTAILTAVPLTALAAIQSDDPAQDDAIETVNAGGTIQQPSGQPTSATPQVATPQPSDNREPAAQTPAEGVTPQQTAKGALPGLMKRHPKHQFSHLVSNGERPWLISINGATVTEWRWNDKKRRWEGVNWAPAGNLTFTDIVRQDVTDDGRDDFILTARDANGHTFGSVLVNHRSKADWADMRGLDGANHGAANYLQLAGSTLVSDYRAHGTRTKVGSHPRTTWRYNGYDNGYPLFIESPG